MYFVHKNLQSVTQFSFKCMACQDSHPAPGPGDSMESRAFTSQFVFFFVQLSLICLYTQLLYIIIIQSILRGHAAMHRHNCWHNLSAVLKCKTALCIWISKSDLITSWQGKPELYKGMVNSVRLFILTVQCKCRISVLLASIHRW